MHKDDCGAVKLATLVGQLSSLTDEHSMLSLASGRLVRRARQSFTAAQSRIGDARVVVEFHPIDDCLRGVAIGIDERGRVALARFSEHECWAALWEQCAVSQRQRRAAAACVRQLARAVQRQGPALLRQQPR